VETRLKVLLLGLAGAVLFGVYYYRGKIMDLIKQFEGFSATPYPDPPGSGKFSIGWGHQIQPGENLTSVTPAQADVLLAADMALSEKLIVSNISYPLDHTQHAALVSFVYNIGAGNFLKGTVPDKINNGDLTAAGQTMQEYIYSGGVVSPALISRRAIEAAPFLS
jgi:lysozyme